MDVVPPGTWSARLRSIPSRSQESITCPACGSSPSAVSRETLTPSSRRLWAMFRPTPPMLTVTLPGLESRPTSGPADCPPMSTFTAPATTT